MTPNASLIDRHARLSGWLAMACLAGILAWSAWRVTLEGGIWCDEIFSIMLVRHSPGQVVALTAYDGHPPLFYLVFKAWNHAGRAFGLQPTAPWGRVPGLAGWAILAAMAWRVGRRTLGGTGGPWLALAICCSAQGLWAARNLRSYSTATPATGICFLLMYCLLAEARAGRLSRSSAGLAWLAYGVAASVALWSHLLASFVIMLLGLAWLGQSIAMLLRHGWRAALRNPLIVGGALAQSAVVLGYVPWLRELDNQISCLAGGRRPWMTALTLANLFRVFTFWYPWGRAVENWSGPAAWPWETAWGCLGLALPASCVASWLRRSPATGGVAAASSANAALLAWLGLGVGLLNSTILWGLDWTGVEDVFYGPRYTLFGNAAWAAGLVGAAFWVSRDGARRARRWATGALLAAWILPNLAGMILETFWERDEEGLPKAIALAPEGSLPPNGSPLYVFPSCLAPYFRKTLSRWDARPVEAMAQIPDGAQAWFLCLNAWSKVDGDRERSIMTLLLGGALGGHVTKVDFPKAWRSCDSFAAFRVDGFRAGVARALEGAISQEYPMATSSGIVERATPSQWRVDQGWNAFVPDYRLNPQFRWPARPRVNIEFKRPLGPGKATIDLRGTRPAFTRRATTLRVGFEGEPDSAVLDFPVGWLDRRVTLTLRKRHVLPALWLESPAPSDAPSAAEAPVSGAGMPFLLHDATVVAVDSGAVLNSTRRDQLP
jgi:hypothetical protein